MTQHSSQRITADNNFLKIQTRSLALDRILSESEIVAQQRDANTARLREQRMAKESADREAALAAPAPKKTRRASSNSAT
ncbi:MAG: hypothetical protein EOP23_00295 [Hyphomicrobiales bacterium]|nr:MAG: hypothetical protein EOP23_00295 [Hyphomicrobiales bacterium]